MLCGRLPCHGFLDIKICIIETIPRRCVLHSSTLLLHSVVLRPPGTCSTNSTHSADTLQRDPDSMAIDRDVVLRSIRKEKESSSLRLPERDLDEVQGKWNLGKIAEQKSRVGILNSLPQHNLHVAHIDIVA